MAMADNVLMELASGIEQVARSVRLTMGPRGKNIIIERRHGAPLVTKDGVTVAKSIVCEDSVRAAGVAICKDVAAKTESSVGDGTSTAVVLLAALTAEGCRQIAAGYNAVGVGRGLQFALADAVIELQAMARQVTDSRLLIAAATISAKDPTAGRMIAECVDAVGVDVAITIRPSRRSESHVEFTGGMELATAHLSPEFASFDRNGCTELDDAFVLLHDGRFADPAAFERLTSLCRENGKSLLLMVGDLAPDVFRTALELKKRRSLPLAVVQAPDFGLERLDILTDLAVYTGAEVFGDLTGLSLSEISSAKLGTAAKVTVRGGSLLIGESGGSPTALADQQARLKLLLADNQNPAQVKRLEKRLASLNGTNAVIYVGGRTAVEMRERKYRVEDAVFAAVEAKRSGIVPGGGQALRRVADRLARNYRSVELTEDEACGYRLLISALGAPLHQIAVNAGLNAATSLRHLQDDDVWQGFSVITGEPLDLFAAGICDPLSVVRAALSGAVSGAMMTLSCQCFVPEAIKPVDQRGFEGWDLQ